MVDRYTKIVLTVIALCLTVIAAKDLGVARAVAQTGPIHVVVDQVGQYAFQYTLPLKVDCSNCR